ncbi:MAG: SPOR domain-containing protein, partial [Desulfotomaculum sp.]|nr:SPOR domain-containing protein [Desulfotomaculum sp.]
MSKTVVGTFPSREQAERAVEELRQQGFEKEISMVAKQEEQQREEEMEM